MTMILEVISQNDAGVTVTAPAIIEHVVGNSRVTFLDRVTEFDNLNLAIQYLMGFGYVRIAANRKKQS